MVFKYLIMINSILCYLNINQIHYLLILIGDKILNTVEDYKQQGLRAKNKDYKFCKERIEN